MLGDDGSTSGLETLNNVAVKNATHHGQGVQKALERAMLEYEWGIHF